CASVVPAASAEPKVAHRHELAALFFLDKGWRPVSDYDLAPYDRAFHRVLGACRISPTQLTDTTIHLAEKATYLGARVVTNLMLLKAIARRITWTKPVSCTHTFNLAEGHLEAGDP